MCDQGTWALMRTAIRAARSKKGWTQLQAAVRVGLSESAYKRLEYCARTLPSPQVMAQMKDEMGLDVAGLLSRMGYIEPSTEKVRKSN